MRAARDYGLTITAWRALPKVDRMLALALAIHESTLCSGCGQDMAYSMDPDLADEWTTGHPDRCHACTALERASDRIKESGAEHADALKITPGLREGWQGRRDKARAERAATAAADPAD